MLFDPSGERDVTESDKINNLLLSTADYLENNKWGQGAMMGLDGSVCLVGALVRVETGENTSFKDWCAGKTPLARKAISAISTYLNKNDKNIYLRQGYSGPDSDYKTVTIWNDHYERSKQEVVSVLREVANIK
jgi:hypothetical protein